LVPGQLAVDPGIINLMTVGFVDPRTGKWRTMSLSQGRWYAESGADEFQRKHARQDRVFQRNCLALPLMGRLTLKTAKAKQVIQHARVREQYMDELCSYKLRRSRCEARYAPDQ
jgi:hypothetical protein